MQPKFVGKKAQHLNYKEDGIKIRATSFKNSKVYRRTQKHKNQLEREY